MARIFNLIIVILELVALGKVRKRGSFKENIQVIGDNNSTGTEYICGRF